jgi:hypothetical protein
MAATQRGDRGHARNKCKQAQFKHD